jgi:hypothetical protein
MDWLGGRQLHSSARGGNIWAEAVEALQVHQVLEVVRGEDRSGVCGGAPLSKQETPRRHSSNSVCSLSSRSREMQGCTAESCGGTSTTTSGTGSTSSRRIWPLYSYHCAHATLGSRPAQSTCRIPPPACYICQVPPTSPPLNLCGGGKNGSKM